MTMAKPMKASSRGVDLLRQRRIRCARATSGCGLTNRWTHRCSTFEDHCCCDCARTGRWTGALTPPGRCWRPSSSSISRGDRRPRNPVRAGTARKSPGRNQRHASNYLIVNELDNVQNRLYALQHKDGNWTRERWTRRPSARQPRGGIDPDESDDYFMTFTGFSPSLPASTLGRLAATAREKLKRLPAFFKPTGLEISQHRGGLEATARRVPYFQVAGRASLPTAPTQPCSMAMAASKFACCPQL